MSNGTARPILAVTLGDPVGIGPEITARVLAEPEATETARPLAVGDATALRRAVEVCGLDVEVNTVSEVSQARFEPGAIDILDLGISPADLPWGQVDGTAGRSAVAAIETATRAALEEDVDAIVTSPINKEAIWAAGSEHLGHTEMLGELTGSDRFNTMFWVQGLKIFFATRHMSLRRAVESITKDNIAHSIREAYTALEVFGTREPRLAVAALNPHGGENGKFGDEEITAIAPAVEEARAAGLNVFGPIPADSVFHQGLQGRYDGVLSLYHDQGHIASKTVDFDGTVSVTVGLPILRTSVDHGTAFDIAGTGQADPGTMRSAFRAAVELAPFAGRLREVYPPKAR
ncbi:4-hydroxythreonine-4-phosphate dehydrogenase [Saccharopolyspora erythraea NRRL 2338]|uniref:4-hydroxythreonine-4-phosphate dehydrogenase n=2 Tax=Saccharopolyspora erythraea TaxID=1836 RepID=A4FFA9_SACEN|nr:4-hydroxythreonine-4-phosphate dehydrogenase PdxA [Saccharopolyspora erythraea]EQD82191.1 4-hydroxythreonine-4-phosphate dehydrogenase [Saccharopolyspora erythraea D]PFG96457.1 4-hydroxythreonine-4-phosphate dehydrogenase [Saccharopolyspora erythraea NRRL 2338]QRK92952.1 4-hydroxythreonine-4-phosphate dehydrogenase PdxA [Saccharopolyspora erythraea]CAM02734.1 4-hydroxythreonine-4-phosphate dehydrogenase [Saccharopolyspora erythraea NRRL 2338]